MANKEVQTILIVMLTHIVYMVYFRMVGGGAAGLLVVCALYVLPLLTKSQGWYAHLSLLANTQKTLIICIVMCIVHGVSSVHICVVSSMSVYQEPDTWLPTYSSFGEELLVGRTLHGSLIMIRHVL